MDYSKIIANALNGDPKALDELYAGTARAVYFTCLSFVKNEQDAEDLMQNTYITAFKKLPTLAQPEKFEAWIKRIAANLSKDFLAKKGAHIAQSLDDENGFFEPVDEGILPDEYIVNAEKREIVMKIIRESLSDVLYQTVFMFYFDEMSIAEIADEMNCPEGTVKYRLNAARAKIKKGVLDYEKRSDDKLYAFVGLPFLTRLLVKQSEMVGVPNLDLPMLIPSSLLNASPFVPEAAAGQKAVAKNILHGGRKAMLSTLKGKIIAGAAAAVVVGGGVAAAAAIANNHNDGYPGQTESNTNSFETQKQNSSSNNSYEDIDWSESHFWFARQTWTEAPRTEFEGGILGDNRKSIDLRDIDELSAPFYSYALLEEATDYKSDRFEDCLNSTKMLLEPGEDVTVETQKVESGEPWPPYDGLNKIMFFNFDSETHTVAECYERGWWKNYIGTVYPDETRALGLDGSLKETGISPDESDLLDAVKAKFGTPHYIRYGSIYAEDAGLNPKEALYKELAKEFDPAYKDGIVAPYYDMIYDYGDFLMVVKVWEQLSYGTYNKTDLVYVEFWGRECWEHRRDIEPFDGGEREGMGLFTLVEGASGSTQSKPEANSKSSDSKPEASSKSPDSKQEESSQSLDSKPEDQNASPFWFARQTWTEAPRTEFEGGFLIDNRKTIDVTRLDDICAPFYNRLMNTEKNIADRFSDVLNAEEDIPAENYTDVETQYVGYGEPLPEFSGVQMIRIFNFDNIAHSVYDCWENNWWKITVDENYGYFPETVSLGLDISLRDTSDEPHEEAMLDAILEKFGTPHYVRYIGADYGDRPDRRQAMLDDIARVDDPDDTGSIVLNYDLIYDYGDFVMLISVWEQRRSSDVFTVSVDYIEFWGKLCWENRDTVEELEEDYRSKIELFELYQ